MEGYTSKPLELPAVNTFAELFEHAEEWGLKPGQKDTRTPANINSKKVGPFCCVSGHPTGYQSLWVKPTPAVLDVVRNMWRIVGGTVYFECVVRDDGSCLVIVKWDQILGSRYLALIPASELDRFNWKE